MWFCGPSFLCDDTCEWPKQPSFLLDLSCSDSEVRKTGQCFAQAQNLSSNVLHRLFTRYSNFHGLLRTVVWLLRYKKYLYHKRLKKGCRPNTVIFNAMEIEEARLEIIKAVQREAFSEVFTALMNYESFDVPRHLVQENDLQHNKEPRVLLPQVSIPVSRIELFALFTVC